MTTESAEQPLPGPAGGGAIAGDVAVKAGRPPGEPVLCQHCGRTASNGISCQGICVADSGY